MAVNTATRAMPDTYFDLVKEFPLVHIRDDSHMHAAHEVIDRLLRDDLDEGEEEYLEALTDLVETYEDEHHPIPDAPEADVLRLLMESNGISQPQLAARAGIAQSTISAVLNGKRPLTRVQVARLAKFFNVPPATFMPA